MTYAEKWNLLVDRTVGKKLRAIPKNDALRILEAISEMAANPYAGDVLRMQGEEDVWRRRIGAYRIFFEVIAKERVVHVYDVVRRSSTTY